MARFKKGYWLPTTQPVVEILLVSQTPPDATKLDLCSCKNKDGVSDKTLHKEICFEVCGDITRGDEPLHWRVPIVSVKSNFDQRTGKVKAKKTNRTHNFATHTVRVRYDKQQLRCNGVLVDTLPPFATGTAAVLLMERDLSLARSSAGQGTCACFTASHAFLFADSFPHSLPPAADTLSDLVCSRSVIHLIMLRSIIRHGCSIPRRRF